MMSTPIPEPLLFRLNPTHTSCGKLGSALVAVTPGQPRTVERAPPAATSAEIEQVALPRWRLVSPSSHFQLDSNNSVLQ